MRHEDYLPFKVDRPNGHDEIIARTNLLVGRAAFETARRRYPKRVDYHDGARIIAHRSGDAFDGNQAPALVAAGARGGLDRAGDKLGHVSGHPESPTRIKMWITDRCLRFCLGAANRLLRTNRNDPQRL